MKRAEVALGRFEIRPIVIRLQTSSGVDSKNIQQAAIPKRLAIKLHLLTVIEIYVYAPFLQRRIGLRSPTYPRLSKAGRSVTKNSPNIVKTASLTTVELLHSLIPTQWRLVHG